MGLSCQSKFSPARFSLKWRTKTKKIIDKFGSRKCDFCIAEHVATGRFEGVQFVK